MGNEPRYECHMGSIILLQLNDSAVGEEVSDESIPEEVRSSFIPPHCML